MDEMTAPASGRLFRAYSTYCSRPDADSLFNLLTAMHSLNDQLKEATGRDLHEIPEFLALKAIRNFTHHQEEVASNVRLVPPEGYSDLMMMCIVRRDQVDQAIQNIGRAAHRDQAREACEKLFLWYGDAVDINPCIFNLIVKIYELLIELDQRPPAADVADFESSYQHEEANGFSHYVTGQIAAPAGHISDILRDIASGLPAPG